MSRELVALAAARNCEPESSRFHGLWPWLLCSKLVARGSKLSDTDNVCHKEKVMRHRRAGWKLGRNTEHRRALLRNLVTSLIVEERIETTITKAKAMRPHVDKMITLGKRGDVAARRLAGSYLMTRDAVDKLFDTISPRYGDREGGYTRIVHGGFRQGDGGDIAFVELLGSEKTLDEKRQKRTELRAKRAEESRKALESAQEENKAMEGQEAAPESSSEEKEK
jgi:large subunit ribosomal protein L17